MNKRIISALLALAVVGAGVAAPVADFAGGKTAISASALQNKSDFEYELLEDGTAKIKRYKGTESKVVFPSEIDGYKVTSLGSSLFFNDIKNLVTEIVIPDTVVSFSVQSYTKTYDGFTRCSNLEKITFSKNLTEIPGDCCRGLKKLSTVVLPNGVTTIGKDAFSSCTSLKKIDIPSSCTTLGESVFYASGLESVTIPKNVTSIPDSAFSMCESLSSVNLNDSLKTLDARAFSNCNSLEKISIPKSVTSIDEFAFMCCKNLKTIDFSSESLLNSMGSYSFSGCSSLEKISIPSNVKKINMYSFSECDKLKNVELNNVESIDFKAFYNCSSLKSITIPKTVTIIGRGALGYYSKNVSGFNIAGSGEDDKDTADLGYVVPGFKIYCYNGTAGEKYAISNKMTYELIGDAVSKKNISKATMSVKSQTYTGKALNPAPTVTLDGKTLKKGTDYTVSYKNNKNCGKATVTVTGKGDYTGTKSGSFIIKPKKVTAKKLTSPKTKQVKLTWTKAKGGVTGYQIVLGLNKKMTSGKKTVWVKKAATTAKTVSGLKAKKTYYAKVRAYKTVSGKKYYGAWSAVKSVKTK